MNELSANQQYFASYKEMIVRESRARKEQFDNPQFSTLLPEELRIQLTTDCNLRCKHCFQWSRKGYYSQKDARANKAHELSYSILEKIIKQTYEAKSSIYLWGGEPLLYSNWDSLIILLENDNRSKVISTNGIYVGEKIDSINRISENLEVVFSLDGLIGEHDFLRGKGAYNKTVSNIKLLVKEKSEGRFKGKITINCSIHNELVNKLFKFTEFCNTLFINKLVMGFPWYISESTCKKMDDYYKKNFGWLNKQIIHYTWHSFNYHLDPSLLLVLENEINKINNQTYNFILRFHPDIKNDLRSILKGEGIKNGIYMSCLAPSCRMAVWANGDVGFCGDFPEFCIGNLENSDIKTIWKNEEFDKSRKIFNTIIRPASLCQRCRFSSNNLT